MNQTDRLKATVDAEGRLVLPAEVASQLGLRPGVSVSLDRDANSVCLRRPIEQLAKVYVEPTTRCNLNCRTCIRNSWDDPPGEMDEETFTRVLQGLQAIDPMPNVFFGGFGEPLTHPRILDMIADVIALAKVRDPRPKVELITNACLLNEATSRRLIEIGLDTLWVSLDGIRPESYEDVRLGALLPEVLHNLHRFHELRMEHLGVRNRPRDYGDPRLYFEQGAYHSLTPELGIAFVAMKRNIGDLQELRYLAHQLGATRFNVSNILPYTAEMESEILYEDSLGVRALATPWNLQLDLPQLSGDDLTALTSWQGGYLTGWYGGSLTGGDVTGVRRNCPFVEAGSAAISWRGNVSPCLPLLHGHTEFLKGSQRHVLRHVVGNVLERDLKDIWSDPDYVAFRQRVRDFDFPECVACGGCILKDSNEEDCEDEIFPRCGACLWSHGLIRCP